jgi:hypothetical protein
MTKVLVVEDDVVDFADLEAPNFYDGTDEVCLYPCCTNYQKCDNCGAGDAVGIRADGTFDDPVDDALSGWLPKPGSTVECYNCGATLEFNDNLDATGLYCRHNIYFDENCLRCEIEGTEFPA